MTDKLISLTVAVSILGTSLAPLSVFAQAASNADAISQLLSQIQALQAQIQELQRQQRELQVQEQQSVSDLLSALREGSAGDEVKTLQALLAADSEIYPEGLVTGYFGSLTAKAVRRFQNKHGLEQVGFVGPRTRQKLNDLLGQNPIALESATSTTGGHEKRPCAIVPPGHLIAPGWLRKHDGIRPVVPTCQVLPPGIMGILGRTATTTPPTPTSTPDVVPPVISSVMVSNIASSTATVSWLTNEAATSKLYYSTSSPVVSSTAIFVSNDTLVTNHAFSLTNLMASTTHYYYVESADASGNKSASSEQSFVTTP